MIAALNEVSGSSPPPPRSSPVAAAGQAFGALLSRVAPQAAREATVGARATVSPAVASELLGSAPPSADADPAAAPPSLEAGSNAPEPVSGPAAHPQPPAGPGGAAPSQPPAAVAVEVAPVPDTLPGASPKPVARKSGSAADTNDAPSSGAPAAAAQPGFALQPLGLLQPPIPPVARAADPAADAGDATAAGPRPTPQPDAASAAQPPAPAPGGDAPAQPGGDFRALLSSPPPAQAAPHPTPAAGLPQPERAAPPVARGDQLGLEIVRHLGAGKEMLSVALSPDSLGRVEVQMRFDETGTLRAVVSASTPEALALLHRDHALLDQAMNSAGVRTDAQSFQFDSRTGGDAERRPDTRDAAERDRGQPDALRDLPDSAEAAVTPPLRSSGMLDLLA